MENNHFADLPSNYGLPPIPDRSIRIPVVLASGGTVSAGSSCWTSFSESPACGSPASRRPGSGSVNLASPRPTVRNTAAPAPLCWSDVDAAYTRATIRSDAEIVAISQLIATVCTSHPRLDVCEAVQIARNAGFQRGAKVVETPDCGSACCISSCLFQTPKASLRRSRIPIRGPAHSPFRSVSL